MEIIGTFHSHETRSRNKRNERNSKKKGYETTHLFTRHFNKAKNDQTNTESEAKKKHTTNDNKNNTIDGSTFSLFREQSISNPGAGNSRKSARRGLIICTKNGSRRRHSIN